MNDGIQKMILLSILLLAGPQLTDIVSLCLFDYLLLVFWSLLLFLLVFWSLLLFSQQVGFREAWLLKPNLSSLISL